MTEPNNIENRRDFLKQTAVAGLAAGAAANFSLNSAIFAGNDDTIKVGLVGCGGRGTGAAKQACSTSGRMKLTAVADAFENNAKSAAEAIQKSLPSEKQDRVAVDNDHTFWGFDAYEKLINSGVDLVILATPPGFRPIHFDAAVKASKHVFMEKPVAVDGPGVRMVLAANKIAKEKKLKVGVGLQRHHQASYLETLKRIKDGAIGDVMAFRAYWNGGGVWDPRLSRADAKSEMEYQMRNWYYYTWLSGDHIVEQHIHNLDVCNWVMDAYPVRCNGMGGRQVRTDKRYGEIYDHHAVEYEYANGVRLFSQCRHIPNCWNSVSEFAHGTKGKSDLGGVIDNGAGTWKFRDKNPDPYQVEHDDLFRAIRENLDYNEADNGAYSSLTAIMGRMATYSGQIIAAEEALNSELNLMPKEFSWTANPQVMPNAEGVYPIPMPGITKAL
ncbi:MAG: Gfo/Idh/MocA family oxidoreductase [Planctomycetaceae bacterium]